MISKEKSTIEKIKMLYKKENKRPNNNDNENVGQQSKKCKKLRLEVAEPTAGNSTSQIRKLSPVVKVKKVQRKTVSVKTNNLKPKRSQEISPLKPEINRKSPKIGAQKWSPDPKLDTEKVSPVPKVGTEIGSPSTKPSSKSKSPVSKGKVVHKKVDESLHPVMFSSPSLKPVKIKKLIEQFEDNVKEGERKAKIKNAFEALMVSRGDAQIKTPKRKLKRIASQKSTRKEGSVLEKWLRK